MSEEFGKDFDPVALGVVRAVKVITTGVRTELLVTFWDRGALVVRAELGEHCTLDVRPAPRQCVCVNGVNADCPMHGVVVSIGTAAQQRAAIMQALEDPRLYEAARDACFACGVPWTDPRTGVTHLPPPLTDEAVDAFLVNAAQDPERAARIRRTYEAMSAKTNDRPADEPKVVDDPEHHD